MGIIAPQEITKSTKTSQGNSLPTYVMHVFATFATKRQGTTELQTSNPLLRMEMSL